MRVLHVVGGKPSGRAYAGTYILHKALLKLKIKSKILNNNTDKVLNKPNLMLST